MMHNQTVLVFCRFTLNLNIYDIIMCLKWILKIPIFNFRYPKANFGQSSRDQGSWPNVNHCVYSSLQRNVTGGLVRRLVTWALSNLLVKFESET